MFTGRIAKGDRSPSSNHLFTRLRPRGVVPARLAASPPREAGQSHAHFTERRCSYQF
jgi:hypothetical protein